jgi:hypothetical protein
VRFSLEDDITDRQLENGAIFCGRFTPVFEPSLRDERYIPEENLFVWTPPERDRYLDGGLFLKLDQVAALKADDRFDPLSAVIPISPAAIRRAFEQVMNLARVDIREALFDALHSEAEARFKEARLTKTERDIMLGSALRILPGSQADLASIQNKLDWHFLDGKTYEEAKNDLPIIPADQIISAREMMAKWGVLEIPEASPTVIRHFPNVVLRILAA